MANKITNTEHYAAIANAIRRKNGETDTYTPSEMAAAIGRIPKGGSGAAEGDVTFYDYDGTVVTSYTASQFVGLPEMPENPDHTDEGLTSQGWNWSLANAKAYVAKYGKLNVGQMYVPTDGKTHVFVDIPADDPQYDLELYFGATAQTVIDWGDGSPAETYTNQTISSHLHTYLNPGEYEVSISVSGSGKIIILGNANARQGYHFNGYGGTARNLSRIKKVYLGNNLETIGGSSFYYCNSLESVTIPNTATTIGTYAFSYCYNLKAITIPNGATSIGEYAFSNCTSAKSIMIPATVTSIGNRALYYTYSLKHIGFPDAVTNIPGYVLNFAPCLKSVIIPNDVTNIGANAFASCYSMMAYHITPTTPPTLENINAFNNISDGTVIYVPADSVDAYKTATNWSTYASRIVAEPE